MAKSDGSWLLIAIIAALVLAGGGVAGVAVMSLGKLNASQIMAVAENAGFIGDDLVTAVAVALAESSGNPSAYNPETAARGGTPEGMGSYGLWQIYLKMHPEFQGQDLTDPQTNANAAYSVYSKAGNSFTPWSTFTTGAYQANLQAATDALSA